MQTAHCRWKSVKISGFYEKDASDLVRLFLMGKFFLHEILHFPVKVIKSKVLFVAQLLWDKEENMMSNTNDLLNRINNCYSSMSKGQKMLATYITDNYDKAVFLTAAKMGETVGVSESTKLGINVCKFLAKIFGWHHRSKLVESLSFGGPYKKYDLSGKTLSNSWLTKDEDIVKFYYSEPRCTFKFTLNGYLGLMEAVLYDNQLENVKKVPNKLPIFIVSGQDDPVGDNGVGVKKVYDLFKEAGSLDITYKLYENDRHEILNETDRDKVYADLLAWMRVRIDT